MTPSEVIASVLLVGGTVFAVTAAIGVVRLPDVFARMHAATKAATFGFLGIAAGAAVVLNDPTSITKLVLAAAFQLVTAPTAAHMVSRAAHRAGTELGPRTVRDDLGDAERAAAAEAAAPAHDDGPPDGPSVRSEGGAV